MQLAVLVIAVTVAVVSGEDSCGPPKPGEKHVHPMECCKMEGFIVEAVKSGAMKCRDKFPHPPHHAGPPPPGPPPPGPPPPPTPEMKNHHACMAECIYTEAGIVKGGKVDKAAASKALTYANSEVQSAVTAALDKCFSSYEKDMDASLECKSGAAELEKCVMREVFINCPASLSTESPECAALKTKVSSCPKMPIMMMMRGGPPPPPPKPHPQ